MDIDRLNKRITFQKSSVKMDNYGNRKPEWEDYFSCWATVVSSGRRSEENQQSVVTEEENYINITVRWSSETRAVNSKEYRIVIDGDLYDILSCDNCGYHNRMRLFTCALIAR